MACKRRPFSCSWPVATKRQKLTPVAVLDQNWTSSRRRRLEAALARYPRAAEARADEDLGAVYEA